MKSETFHFPAFDYDLLKDPVPDQLKYEKGKHKIILIEGSNVLSKNEPWSQISQMFDKMYFLHTSQGLINQRMRSRKKEFIKTNPEMKKQIINNQWTNLLPIDFPQKDMIKDLNDIIVQEILEGIDFDKVDAISISPQFESKKPQERSIKMFDEFKQILNEFCVMKGYAKLPNKCNDDNDLLQKIQRSYD